MADAPGAEPVGDAYFGFYLLAMGRGRPRTRRAKSPTCCASAGFAAVRRLTHAARPLLASALTGDASVNLY